jgi:hypothetical protein
MPPDERTTLRLRDHDLHWRVVGGEAVVLDLDRPRYLGANPVGTVLWASLAEGATDAALAESLVKRYGLDPATAASDVRTFFAALTEHGLLQG